MRAFSFAGRTQIDIVTHWFTAYKSSNFVQVKR